MKYTLQHGVTTNIKTFKTKLVNLSAASMFALTSLSGLTPLFLSGTAHAAGNTYHQVTSSDTYGWNFTTTGDATGSFSTDPSIQTRGDGSYELKTTSGKKGYLYDSSFSSRDLTSLQQLSYSYFVAHRQTSSSVAPSLSLITTINGTWTELKVEPTYTNGAPAGSWQTINAFASTTKWYSTHDLKDVHGNIVVHKFNGVADLTDWQTLVGLDHSAKLGNDDGANGVRFTIGQNSGGAPWGDFDSYIDNVIISSNSYDFEPTFSPAVTPAEFTTISDTTHYYKGIDAGFTLNDDFGTLTDLNVKLYSGDTLIGTNTAQQPMLSYYNGGGRSFTTPFVIQKGAYDPASDNYWNFSSYNWNRNQQPTKVVITATGTHGTDTKESTSLTFGGGTFASLFPADTTPPTITNPSITNDALWGPGYNILAQPHHRSDSTGLPVIGGTVQVGATFNDDKLLTNVIALLPGKGFFLKDSSWSGVTTGFRSIAWNTKDSTSWQGVADGNYTFEFQAKDGGNGQNQPQNPATLDIPVTVDNTPPSATFSGKTSAENSTVKGTITVNGHFADANGLMNTYIGINTDGRQGEGWKCDTSWPSTGDQSCNIDTTGLADGTYKLTMSVRDKAGNTAQVFRTVTVDNKRPVVQFTQVPNKFVNGSFDVKATITDTNGVDPASILMQVEDLGVNARATKCVGGVPTVTYSTDKTKATLSCTIDTSGLQENYTHYVIWLWGKDAAGLSSSNVLGQSEIPFVVDRTPPAIQIDNKDPKAFYGIKDGMNVHIIDKNVGSTYIDGQNNNFHKVYGNDCGPNHQPCAYFSIKWLPAGTYEMYQIDQAGNRSATVSFTIDKTAPTAAITTIPSTANGEVVQGPVTIIGTVTNEENISSHWFEVAAPDGNKYYWYRFNTSDLSVKFDLRDAKDAKGNTIPTDSNGKILSGKYTVRYVATDKAGNRSDSVSPTLYTLVIDNTPPVITDTFDVFLQTGQTLTLRPTVDDPNVTFSWKPAPALVNAGQHKDDALGTYTIGPAPRGTYDVNLTVKDAAGNETTAEYHVTVTTPANTSGGNSKPNTSTPAPLSFAAPLRLRAVTPKAATVTATTEANGQVLGASTDTTGSDNTGHVKGDSIDLATNNKRSDTANNSANHGFAWWWLVGAAVVVLLFVASLFRRAGRDK